MPARVVPGLPIGTVDAWLALYSQVCLNSGGLPAIGAMLILDDGLLYWSAVA